MNALDYLESRFMSSQTTLSAKQISLGQGESRAVLAWLWVALQVLSIFHFLMLPFHYAAVLIHLIDRPMHAKVIADRFRASKAAEQEAIKKFTEVAKDLAAGKGQA